MYSNVGAVTQSGFSRSKTKERNGGGGSGGGGGERENSKNGDLTENHGEHTISSRFLKFIRRKINPAVGKSLYYFRLSLLLFFSSTQFFFNDNNDNNTGSRYSTALNN